MSNTIKQHDKYVMQTYGRNEIVLAKGRGATAWDDERNEYIDFTSGIGVNSLGFCDKDWARAVCKQAKALNHTSNLYYHKPAAKLAKMLCDETEMSRVFFANSGAEANEGAIKIARKRSFENYGKQRTKIITLVNSFHGRTVTALSATGQDVFHNYFFPFTEGFDYAVAGDIKDLKNKLDDSVCAVMMELVQGEGGVINLSQEYVEEVAGLCKKRDMALIIDEVQTGVGRTGTFMAYMQYDIKPSIVTVAKGIGGGLPIAAVLADKEYGEVLKKGDHGTTYGANPIACAGAIEVVKRVASKKFLNDVNEKSEYTRQRLAKMPHVKSVSGLGLMIGIELDCAATSAEILKLCHQNGLMILTAKAKLRMLPPLTITAQELEKGLDILENILKTVK